jgi:hypothetical protein
MSLVLAASTQVRASNLSGSFDSFKLLKAGLAARATAGWRQSRPRKTHSGRSRCAGVFQFRRFRCVGCKLAGLWSCRSRVYQPTSYAECQRDLREAQNGRNEPIQGNGGGTRPGRFLSEGNHRGGTRSPATQTESAGDDPQFGHADKSVSGVVPNATAVVSPPVMMPGPALAYLQGAASPCLPRCAAFQVRATCGFSQLGQWYDSKCRAENVEVPDGQCDEPEGPGH